MMAMQLAEAADLLDARCTAAEGSFRGVSTDTRGLEPGALFFALHGPRFDGHDFVENARERGAAAAAVSRNCETALPLLRVADTRLALGRLAMHWRCRFDLPVVAITGSNGKTTVRMMTAAILSRCGQVLATRGNLNNDIGLPLTLARLSADDDYAVLEMGANHAGEIAYLTGIARPAVAVVTNAGPAHLEGFRSLEGVARAKGEVFTGLAPEGLAVINAEDAFAPLWRQQAGHCRVVDFGLDDTAAVHAVWEGDAGGSAIRMVTPQGVLELRLPLPGRHNVMNALAATAAALGAGAGLDAVRAGLESLTPVTGRYHTRHLPGGITVIDDSYNANPGSLQAALEVLALSGAETWLVLGDMGELGAGTVELHREAGRHARKLGITRLYALGALAREAAAGFGGPGGAFDGLEELLAALRSDLSGPLQILVKGSRSMRMERVVAELAAFLEDSSVPQGGRN
ncbi:MAG: UDP-N-acetylmuramoyl-tripeptide--D-alanyl-D-alanine ligase [Gammaproteobacteria bacterium]